MIINLFCNISMQMSFVIIWPSWNDDQHSAEYVHPKGFENFVPVQYWQWTVLLIDTQDRIPLSPLNMNSEKKAPKLPRICYSHTSPAATGGKLQNVWLLLPQFGSLYSSGSACSKETNFKFFHPLEREGEWSNTSVMFFYLPYISNLIINWQVGYAHINLLVYIPVIWM